MMPGELLRRHDDSTLAAYAIVSPDLRILAASKAYSDLAMRPQKDLIGRPLFEAFPDDPNNPLADGVREVRASFERAERTRETDELPVVRYDIERPAEVGGGYEVRYWRVVNTPIFDEGGELARFVHAVEDITQRQVNAQLGAYTARVDRRLRRATLESRILYGLVFAGMVFTGYLTAQVDDVAERNSKLLDRQAQLQLARCAATSAVIEAGRETILSQTKQPVNRKQEAALKALGFPPRKVRDQAARDQAQAYADFIAKRVEAVSGEKLLIRKDGSLNCSRLVLKP